MLVIAAVATVVAHPLTRSGRARGTPPASDRLAALEARKEVKYREIRDAEADFRTGKLSEDDYRTIDRALRREAIEILREMDDLRDRGHPERPVA